MKRVTFVALFIAIMIQISFALDGDLLTKDDALNLVLRDAGALPKR